MSPSFFRSLQSLGLVVALALSWLSSLKATADENTKSRLQKVHAITHVQSSSDLQVELRAEKKLAVEQARCEAQLSGNALPGACFWVLKRETQLRLIRAVGEIRDSGWMERLCVRRASESRDLRQLVSVQQELELPERCRSVAQERAADLRYQYESSRPEKLFEERARVVETGHDD